MLQARMKLGASVDGALEALPCAKFMYPERDITCLLSFDLEHGIDGICRAGR